MLITSYIQDSFQEYEGYLSCVLFSHGCNLRCKRCYNLKEVLDKKNIIGNAKEVIDKCITPLHDAVVFLGGEPTIWKDKLVEVAQYIREKYDLKTKLYTNGLLPDVVEKLLRNNLIDAFSVDYKVIDNTEILGVPIKLDYYIKKVESTINLILNYNKELEIRTTKWEGVNYKKIQEYIKNKFPSVKHILTEDFLKFYEKNN